MRGLLVASLLSASSAIADPLVDLPTLFQLHADKVIRKDNGSTVFRELSLNDGVVTRCKGEGFDDCNSIDTNDRGGTTDCALLYATRTLMLTRQCQIGGAASRFMLEKVLNDLGEHVARNAVPPRDWPTLQTLVMERAQRDPLPTCAELDEVGSSFVASRLELRDLQEMQAMTAAPRLPVGKCLD
jgi:hypothetical protein